MEIWKSVKGFEKYSVSNYGRVKSFSKKTPIFLKPGTDTKGYLYVNLWKTNRAYPFRVHLLVLESFKRKRKKEEQGRHLDGNKKNNNLKNLKYGTSKVNHADKSGYGKNNRGSANGGGGKLNIDDVCSILNLLHSGTKQENIAKQFNVSRPMIVRINTGKSWNINLWIRDLDCIVYNIDNKIHKDHTLFKTVYKEFRKLYKTKTYTNNELAINANKRFKLFKLKLGGGLAKTT